MIYNCRCIHCGTVKQMRLSSIIRRKDDRCTHYINVGSIHILNIDKEKSIPDERLKQLFKLMLRRCYDENNSDYRFYGAKGITVCDEWIENPRLFYDWAITHGYQKYLSIDRVQEDKGYTPENCRWIPLIDNSRFKSNTNYITATVTLSGKQWASLIPEHSVNYINQMMRKQGEEKTIEYIENRLKDKRLSNTYNN